MLKIRLKRIGKKHQPIYRIVVTEHTQPVSGQYVEKIGLYNPFTKKIEIDKEKVQNWMDKGAKPSNTVAKLLEKSGLKHKLIVIKKFAAKSKKQLEAEKKVDEEKKMKEQAEKAAQKEAFEKEVEQKKEEAVADEAKSDTELSADSNKGKIKDRVEESEKKPVESEHKE